MDRRRTAAAIVILAACLASGEAAVHLAVTYFRPKPVDLSRPPADVPFPLRVRNYWGGSCYHASTQVALRWADQGAIADNWRNNYGGGASTSKIASILDKFGIPYKCTKLVGRGPYESADISILNYAHDNRLVAAIHYFPNHAISFLGWVQTDGREYACLLDNNRPKDFIFVPKQDFLKRWRSYGGGAIVPLVKAPPPSPYDPLDYVETPKP
ncbi:hypothetical protein ACYFX5_09105 [Bremerella sp. T1]|uniref:hypothetical protein n=1 Tax=Bremerella sp. TYQ1 TaxID=3119568 RepID=UPI001CCEDF64|nr:hypothetical protein [Bremerella volcania]UBM38410.1 hypothetical protein LA756_11040 [Bremerella volcania]